MPSQSSYTVYAIKSLSRNYIYIGMTQNLDQRLDFHNKGYNKTTRAYRPFQLLYSEQADTRKEARYREKYLKTGSGREFLRQFLHE